MLQLVNNGNVALLRPGLETAQDAPPQLQLVKLERHHQQMFSFKAPSLHDKVCVRHLADLTSRLLPSVWPISRHAQLR
jgi:hypothetical protein